MNLLDGELETGYIFEVDLKYPRRLHDLHNSYPLAPEGLNIDESMLSPFQSEQFPSHQKKPSTKLAPNLHNKTNYFISSHTTTANSNLDEDRYILGEDDHLIHL